MTSASLRADLPLSVCTAAATDGAGTDNIVATGRRGGVLHNMQRENGGRFVEFAGSLTPLRYEGGIVKEHLHTRCAAGLFDVSHMNQVNVSGTGAAEALEQLMPRDLRAQQIGKLEYAVLTSENGGILDDLIVTRTGENSFNLVTNACRAQAVNSWLAERLRKHADFQPLSGQSMLALQGPRAHEVVAGLSAEAGGLRPMHGMRVSLLGHDCYVARAGYTGEDGFELSVPDEGAETVARALLASDAVRWCGLGARDSLRLEAGLCLYGQDINEDTTPVEAGLSWTISESRRAGGARAGGFPGAGRILEQMRSAPAALTRRLSGVVCTGPGVVRQGTPLYARASLRAAPVGRVTSGGYSPSLKRSIALAWLPGASAPGMDVRAHLRGRFVDCEVCALPFYSARKQKRL